MNEADDVLNTELGDINRGCLVQNHHAKVVSDIDIDV